MIANLGCVNADSPKGKAGKKKTGCKQEQRPMRQHRVWNINKAPSQEGEGLENRSRGIRTGEFPNLTEAINTQFQKAQDPKPEEMKRSNIGHT